MKLYYFGKKNDLTSQEQELIRRIGFRQDFSVLPLAQAGTTDIAHGKKKESQTLLSKIKDDDFVIALDENGRSYDSPAFAKFLQQCLESSKNMVFVIGGAAGLSADIINRANATLSLGSMVWTKDLARHMILEQIYRGFDINNGGNFHKE